MSAARVELGTHLPRTLPHTSLTLETHVRLPTVEYKGPPLGLVAGALFGAFAVLIATSFGGGGST